tara:strand:- start:79 stop:1155 length:1077 start_codon:yes stop_codon:yes gene_type:complete
MENKTQLLEKMGGEDDASSNLKCLHCDKVFTQKDNLYRHIRKQHDTTPQLRKGDHECEICQERFIRKYNLYNHVRTIHGAEPDTTEKNYVCQWCTEPFRGYIKRKPTLIAEKEIDVCDPCLIMYRKCTAAKSILCPTCHRKFITKERRDKHMKCHKRERKHGCKHCHLKFANPWNCKLHERACSIRTLQTSTHQEESCSTSTSNQFGGASTDKIDDGTLELHKSAFNKTVQVFRLTFNSNVTNLLVRMQSALMQISECVKLEQLDGKSKDIKIYVTLQVNLYKASNPSEVTNPPICFNTEPVIINGDTNLQDILEVFYSDLKQQIDLFETNGSGWVLQSLVYLDLNMIKFNPLRARDR